MWRIADEIEYTLHVIYEYFTNKEAFLLELTQMGYSRNRPAGLMDSAKNSESIIAIKRMVRMINATINSINP
jgi:AcrR family transcriptional regulator